MIQNLINIFERATPANRLAGLSWYFLAHAECHKIGAEFGVDFARVAGAIAAMSPRMPWERNLWVGRELVRGHVEGLDVHKMKLGIHSFIDRAAAILETGNFALLGTQKTYRFWHNMSYPETSSLVTVDTWAHRAWAGLDKPIGSAPTPKNYEFIQADYAALAAECGILPHQAQAIVWETIRIPPPSVK